MTQIRIAWNQSTDRLDVIIPDGIHFESTEAWVWVRDQSTVVVSPDKPVHIMNAEKHPLNRIQGRGERRIQHIARLNGPYFRCRPTQYKVEGKSLYITIPAPENRIPPRSNKYQSKSTAHPPPRALDTCSLAASLPISAPAVSGPVVKVKVLIAWTEFGLPDDAVLEIPIEAAKLLAQSYGPGEPQCHRTS